MKFTRTCFRPLTYCSLLLTLVPAVQSVRAEGGLATDGTAGRVETFTGNTVTIPQGFGTTVGGNLFHSFSQFNINTGQTVTFTEATPNALNNVITRVTGGSQSDINGTLSVTPGGHANFFLLNPAGVFFGKDVVLDVAGAFHASTADQLKFSDGGLLNVDPTQGSSLSSAEPASFGFLASTRANNGLLQVEGATLAVNEGQTLDLVGGEINTENATLNAPGGEIRLVAMRGAREIGLTQAGGVLPLPNEAPTETNAGLVDVRESNLSTAGEGGGRVGVWGGEVNFSAHDKNNTKGVLARNTGAIDATTGQGIEITGNNLNFDGVLVRSSVFDAGNAGNVRVQSMQDTYLRGDAAIYSIANSNSTGNTGNVSVTAGRNLTMDGQYTSIESSLNGNETKGEGDNQVEIPGTGSRGNAGDVTVHTQGNVTLNDSYISSAAGKGSAGSTGNVYVQAQGYIALTTKDSQITRNIQNGNAGTLNIMAGGSLTNSGLIQMMTRGGKQNDDNGDLNVKAGSDITLNPGGQILSNTYANRDAANINISAEKNLLVNGIIKSTHLTEEKTASDNLGVGSSGNINVYAQQDIALSASSEITRSIQNGKAGTLSVIAGGDINSSGFINMEARGGEQNDGRGNLNVKAGGHITLNPVGEISSFTYANRDAANIDISAGKNLLVNGIIKSIHPTEENATLGGAGNISVYATNNIMLDGHNKSGKGYAYIGTTSTNEGTKSADINIFAGGKLTLINTGYITTSINKGIAAGRLIINVAGDIVLPITHNFIKRLHCPTFKFTT